MKNTLLYTYRTNILVRLLTVNMKNCRAPKTPKMCNPILVALLKMRPVNRVMKMQPHPAAHPHLPPPPSLGLAHILLNDVSSIASLLSCSVESPDSSRALALYVRKKRILGKFNSLSPIH